MKPNLFDLFFLKKVGIKCAASVASPEKMQLVQTGSEPAKRQNFLLIKFLSSIESGLIYCMKQGR